jgi:CYTH domain-containing protein
MKKQLTILFLLIAGASFAGKGLVVTQTYNSAKDGQHISVTWYVTQTQCKLKMQFSDKDVNTTSYFIPNAQNNQLVTYSDGAATAQKVYYSIPVGGIKANVETPTIERTSQTKELGGVLCEKIIAKTANATTEMWVTKDFKGDYYQFASFFKNSYELKALSAGAVKGFPLASVTKDNTGKVLNSYELVSVSSTEIADTEFTAPADYNNAAEVKAK